MKDFLNNLEHATWFAQAGMLIFVAVFIAISIRAFRGSRQDLTKWAQLPLDDSK